MEIQARREAVSAVLTPFKLFHLILLLLLLPLHATAQGNNAEFVFVSVGDVLAPIFIGDLQHVDEPDNYVPDPTAPSTSYTSTSVVSSAEQQAMDEIGAIPGSFGVNAIGAATYTIPIAALPGTAGVAPQISLSYNSNAGNGLLGRGWQMGGLSAISRCRKTLQQDGEFGPISWDDEDVFCLDGTRLLLVSGTYGAANSTYRTETDTFATVTAKGGSTGDPAYFEVVRKDMSVSYYGNTSDSSLDGPVSSQSGYGKTLTWVINRFEDSVGNEIVYTYINDTNGQRIDEISYAYGSGSTRNAYLEFVYEDRDDDQVSYLSNQTFVTKKRLSKIIVGGTSALREYRLSYDEVSLGNNSNDELSRLTSIEDCVVSVSPDRCLPKTEFSWNHWSMAGLDIAHRYLSLSTMNKTSEHLADINGDGIKDLVYLEAERFLHYFLMGVDDTDSDRYYVQYTSPRIDLGGGSRYSGVQSLDYNSDGRKDVLLNCYLNCASGTGWYMYLSVPQTGGGWRLSSSATYLSDALDYFVDLNGDGLTDTIGGTSVRYLIKDTGVSPGSSTPYKFGPAEDIYIYPQMSTYSDYEIADIWGVGDFNGDGRADILGRLYRSATGYESFAAYATGYDSGVSAYRFDNMTFSGTGPEGTVAEVVVTDINNDGLSDIIFPEFSAYRFDYRLSEGTNFRDVSSGPVASSGPFSNHIARAADFNGDGYQDIYWRDNQAATIKASFWQPSTQSFGASVNILGYGGSAYSGDHILSDLDSDGRVDMYRVTGSTVRFIPGGNGQYGNVIGYIKSKPEGSLFFDGSRTIHYTNLMNHDTYSYVEGIQGSSSSTFYSALTNPYSGFNDSLLPNNSAPVINFVGSLAVVQYSSYSLSLGNSVESYTYSYEDAKFQTAGRGMLGFGAMTVKNNYSGVESRTEFRQDWPYIGRPVKTTVSLDGELISETENVWSVRTQDSNTCIPSGNDCSTWATTLANDGTAELDPLAPVLIQSTTKTYDAYDATSNVMGTTVTENSYDGYGNVTQNVTKHYAGNLTTLMQTVTADNTYNDTGTGLGATYSQTFGRLTQSIVTTTRGSETITSKSTYDYYDSGQGAPDDGAHTGTYTGHTGMLRSESVWASSDSDYADTPESAISTTYYYYDGFGNSVLSRTDASSESRYSDRTVYESLGRYVDATYGLFANSSGNATPYQISQVMSRDAYGTPTEVRDFVGTGSSDYVTSKAFTTARGLTYFRFDDTGGWSANNTIAGAGTDLCPTGTEFHVRSRSAGGGEAYECFDILGRPVRKLAEGFDGTMAMADTYYDNLGRVVKVSEPYSTTPFYTLTTYDELGRVTEVDGPESGTADTTTFVYEGLETLQTTGRGNARREVFNVLGEVVSVYENKSTDVSSVDGVSLTANERSEAHYQYNAHGNLTLLTDQASNTTSMTYDDIGRKLSMDDMDKGIWTFAYNNFGDQICQEDANGQVMWNTYDFAGRLIERNDYEESRNGVCNASTQTQPTADDGTTLWEYDQADNGLGQLNDVVTLSNASDTTPDYAKSMTFDSLGRLSKTVTNIEGLDDDNWEQITYDEYGRTYQVFDAARNSEDFAGYAANGVEHIYNSYGYLDQIVDAVYDDTDNPRNVYYDVQTMDFRGNVTAAQYGELMDVTAAYEADTGYLRWLAGSDGTTTYQNYDLDWDEVGNLNYRRNMTGSTGGTGSAVTNEDETFVYDSMNRLKTNSVNGTTVTLAYDPIGNITSKSDFGGGYTYGSKPSLCTSVTGAVEPGPHAVSVTSSTSYCYDANGNMIKDTNRTLSYTAYDMVASIDNGTYTTSFAYGPDRGRYKRVDSDGSDTTTTYSIGSVEKVYNDDGTIEWKRDIAGVGQITQIVYSSGTIQSESTAWFLKDHLGSITHIIETNSSGAVDTVTEMAFDPWGKRRTPTDWKTALASLTSFYMTGGGSGSFTTTQGFTGHEMLDEVGIIHMNGRIYDASIARFVQADPFIQAPFLTASHNRYSYVMNNPLNAIDPTGYEECSFANYEQDSTSIVNCTTYSYTSSGVTTTYHNGGARGYTTYSYTNNSVTTTYHTGQTYYVSTDQILADNGISLDSGSDASLNGGGGGGSSVSRGSSISCLIVSCASAQENDSDTREPEPEPEPELGSPCTARTLVCMADESSGDKDYNDTLPGDDNASRDWLGRNVVQIEGTYRCGCGSPDFPVERVRGTLTVKYWGRDSMSDLTLYNVRVPTTTGVDWNGNLINLPGNPVPEPFNPLNSPIQELRDWGEEQLEK